MNETVTKGAILSQARGAPSSDATQVEQSRAIAQVQGALIVAQNHPRDEIKALQRIREACSNPHLADRAFYRYSRGGSQITGPTVHLAAELARCWGNVDFGIVELRRDELRSESEMLAVAWDLETNTRVTNGFIVPHKRDKRGGPEILVDMRDIYENNANHAARRLRECILRILPVMVREEATAVCISTLEHGGGEPIEKRREKLLDAFAEINVSRPQIERKIGIAADRLTAVDIANLRVIYTSLKRGEVTVADEFEPEHGTAITESLKKDAKGAEGKDKAPPTTGKSREPEEPPPVGEESPPPSETEAPPEEPNPSERYRQQMFRNIDECRTEDEIDALEDGFEEHRSAYDDETGRRIDNRFAVRREELKQPVAAQAALGV